MTDKLRWKWFKPEESYNKLKQDIKQLKEVNKALNCTSNSDYIGNLERENKLVRDNNEKLIKLTTIAYNALLGLRGDAREFGFELSPKTLDLMKLLSDLINTKESEGEG